MATSSSVSDADVSTERARVFDQFVASAQRAEAGSVFRLDDDALADVEVIPSGVLDLDLALGVGGLPRGRIVEIYGTPSGGKTALSVQVCAAAQRLGGYVGFIDAEHAFDPTWAESAFGVDPHRFAISQPDNGIEALKMVERMCDSGAFDVIVVDSVTALVPQERADAEIGDANRIGMHAKMMSEGLNKLAPIIAKSRAVVIFINQIRMKPGAYGNPEYTPGGKALPFYASVRIEVRSSASKRINGPGGVPVGQQCTAKVVKNKVAPPHRTAEWDLFYETGISTEGSLLSVAEKLGVIERRSASYTEVASGLKIANGKENAKAALAEDAELAARVTAAVYAAMRPSSTPDELPVPDLPLDTAGALESPTDELLGDVR